MLKIKKINVKIVFFLLNKGLKIYTQSLKGLEINTFKI